MKLKITKTVVDQLLPGQTVFDTEIRGFCIRRQVRGKSYALKCFIDGRQEFVTIGKHGSPWTPEKARKKALKLLLDYKNGIDPVAQRKGLRDRPTISLLCTRYMKEHAIPFKKLRSATSDQQLIKNHVEPLLGSLFVEDVSREHVKSFHYSVANGKTAPNDPALRRKQQRGGKVVTGGKGVANRCLTLLSKIFNLAEDWNLRPSNSNPVRRVPHYPERRRERFLSDAEFNQLGEALVHAKNGIEDTFAIAAIELILFTGARRGEILTLKWDWVDLVQGLILLPDSKTGQKTIYLSGPAIELLQKLKLIGGDNAHVIVGAKPGCPLVNLQKPWSRIRDRAGIPDVRIHDLRHAFASVAAAEGLSLPTIGAVLSHASEATTRRYTHFQKDHVSRANQVVGNAIHRRLAPTVPQEPDQLEEETQGKVSNIKLLI